MAHKLKVTLVRSGINRPEAHKRTLLGLGLRRVGRSKILFDTLPIRGMIFQVQHLVQVERAS